MRRCVARIPGWDKPCSESNTVHLHWRGTRGHCVPVEVLQRRCMSVGGSGIASTTKGDEGEDCNAQICVSVTCV